MRGRAAVGARSRRRASRADRRASTRASTPSSRWSPIRRWSSARLADERLARGESVGPLHGLPIAHKDLQATAGIRTTFGSPIFRDYVPDEDSLLVARLKRAGAITVGKTNTPEFGAGSQTFNPVFGATLNPYDRDEDLRRQQRRRGGRARVRHAADCRRHGHGRIASQSRGFCGVVGMRPSPALGLVPGTVAGSEPPGSC